MKIPASKVPAQVWADKAMRRADLDEVESMLLSSWNDSKQVYRIGKELWDELRIDEADEVPVREVEEGDEVWLESVRGGFEPYRVCGFAVPPSLRRTGVRLPFVEMYNAEEGREAVLLNPNNFIRSATVRVTR